MQISLSRLHFPITTLGPGRRIGVWFQGCSIHCPGCISRDTWEAGLGMTDLELVEEAIHSWCAEADGLTITGGEPFDQPEALEALLQSWQRWSNTSVLVFTGYEFQRVAPWLERHLGLIDALIAGPYIREAGQTLALRGSDNQTLHVLSDRGEAFWDYERSVTSADRRLDAVFDESGQAWFAGIPAPDMMLNLRQSLVAEGHSATTSEQKGIVEEGTSMSRGEE